MENTRREQEVNELGFISEGYKMDFTICGGGEEVTRGGV